MKKDETIITPQLYEKLIYHIKLYGIDAFESYIDHSLPLDQLYTCKSNRNTVRIFFKDISHLTIRKHEITVHTTYGTYRKYGSLTKELTILSQHGFIFCSQSCLVSISKIAKIHQKEIILIDGTPIPMSQRCAKKTMLAYSSYCNRTKDL